MELQRAYEEDKKAGRHLFERGDINWNQLPSPVPDSFKIDLPVQRIVQRNQTLIEEFEQAEAAGVVVKDEYMNWHILKTEDLDISAWTEQLGGIMTNGRNNPKKMQQILPKLKEKLESAVKNASPVRIEIWFIPSCKKGRKQNVKSNVWNS